MQAAQEDFQLALDQMNSVYSAMTEEQDNLLANWSGMAASAFGQALGAWLDDLYQIRQELVVMTESLSTHTGIYSDANETSQQVVTAFQQGLSGLESLPGEPVLLARRAVEGKLLPEKGVLARGEVVQGQTLPVAREAEREPLMPALRMEAVEGIPAQPRFMRSERPTLPEQPRFLESERPTLPELPLLPEAPTLPTLPVLPSLRLREAPIEPLQPERLDLPESRTS
jgi:uncharacterized protein YukE